MKIYRGASRSCIVLGLAMLVGAPASAQINLLSNGDNAYGPALDNIRLFEEGGVSASAAAPEPATLLLLGCGGLLMSVRMRRRPSKARP
jgi:hypothetical protein